MHVRSVERLSEVFGNLPLRGWHGVLDEILDTDRTFKLNGIKG